MTRSMQSATGTEPAFACKGKELARGFVGTLSAVVLFVACVGDRPTFGKPNETDSSAPAPTVQDASDNSQTAPDAGTMVIVKESPEGGIETNTTRDEGQTGGRSQEPLDDAASPVDVPCLGGNCEAAAECDADTCSAQCSDANDSECISATERRICMSGQWMVETCKFACVASACTGSCVPGTARCSGANTSQVCQDDGTWAEETDCPPMDCATFSTECRTYDETGALCINDGECKTRESCTYTDRASDTVCEFSNEEQGLCDGAGHCQAVPRVVSTDPVDGESGVAADETVSLVFNTAMDVVSVEKGISLVPTVPFTFEWSADQTRVFLRPDEPLAYAEGDALDLEPASYEITLSSGVLSAEGVPSAQPFAIRFETLRRLRHTLLAGYDPREPEKNLETVVLVSDGDVDECTAGDLWVGEFRDDTTSRALVTFRLSDLPGGIMQVEQAVLRFTEETRSGTPFGENNLGKLLVEHVSVGTPITGTAFNAPAIRLLGSIDPDAPEGVSMVDATAAFEADYSDGSPTSQFRLRFEKSIALGAAMDHVVIGCVNPNVELALDYLIP